MFSEFTNLPQVRMSQRQQLISSKPKKYAYPCQILAQPVKSALVSGLKPFYTHSRKQNSVFCGHLKCGCKASLRNHGEGVKHQYLTRRKDGENELMVRYSTGLFEKKKDAQCKPSRNLQRQNQHFRNTTEGIATVAYQQQSQEKTEQKLYDKIRKQLSKRIFLKFGKLAEKQKVNALILEYIQKNFQKREPLKNIDGIFKKVEMFLAQSGSKQPMNIFKENKLKLFRKIPNYSNQKIKKQKTKKGSDKKRHKQEKTYSPEIDDEAIDLINLLFFNDKAELTDQFMEEMVSSKLEKFNKNMGKVKKIAEKYQNQPSIMKVMREFTGYLLERLEKTQLDQKVKFTKIGVVQSMLRSKIPFENNIEAQPLSRSKKIGKTIKIKRSQKTMGSINLQLISQQEKNSQTKKPRAKSTMSLVEKLSNDKSNSNQRQQQSMLLINHQSHKSTLIRSSKQRRLSRSSRQSRLSRQSKSRKWKKSSIKSVISRGSRYHDMDLKVELKQLSKNEELCQDLTESQMQEPKKKKEVRKSIIDPKSNLNPIPQPKTPPQSCFKQEKVNQVRLLHQNRIKYSRNIKQLLSKNQSAIEKGRKNLRQCQLSNLIINQYDTVLTKKKKIRFIRDKINQVSVLNNSEIVQELLAYIQLYRFECQLILGKGFDGDQRKRNSKVRKDGDEGEFRLIKKSMFNEELKFIKLSNDYFYGQQDEEFDFKTTNRYEINQIKPEASRSQPQKIAFPSQTLPKFQNALIQTSLPQVGHLLTTKPVSVSSSVSSVPFPPINNLHSSSQVNIKNNNNDKNVNREDGHIRQKQQGQRSWKKKLQQICRKLGNGNYRGSHIDHYGKLEEKRNGNQSQKTQPFLFTQNTINEIRGTF